jgi:hypothetical protein
MANTVRADLCIFARKVEKNRRLFLRRHINGDLRMAHWFGNFIMGTAQPSSLCHAQGEVKPIGPDLCLYDEQSARAGTLKGFDNFDRIDTQANPILIYHGLYFECELSYASSEIRPHLTGTHVAT